MRIYSTAAVAQIVGCSNKTVNDWFDCGMLKGHRLPQPTVRTGVAPTGRAPKPPCRMIPENALLEFAERYGLHHVRTALGHTTCLFFGFRRPEDVIDVVWALPAQIGLRPTTARTATELGFLSSQAAVVVFGPLAPYSAAEELHAANPRPAVVTVPNPDAYWPLRPWARTLKPSATPRDIADAVSEVTAFTTSPVVTRLKGTAGLRRHKGQKKPKEDTRA